MSKEQAQTVKETFVTFLQEEGYKVVKNEWDPNSATWDVQFKYEGLGLLAIFDADDDQFVRLILPNFYSLDSEEERFNAVLCVSKTNGKCKGAKVYLNGQGDDVIATCEFLDNGGKVDYSRYLSMLKNAAGVFAANMREG